MSRSLLGLLGLSTVATVASMNLVVKGAGSAVVNGLYLARPPAQIPVGFARWHLRNNVSLQFMLNSSIDDVWKLLMLPRRTCDEMVWDSPKMWKQLSNQVSPWWKHSDNESYIYYNKGDGQVIAFAFLQPSSTFSFSKSFIVAIAKIIFSIIIDVVLWRCFSCFSSSCWSKDNPPLIHNNP